MLLSATRRPGNEAVLASGGSCHLPSVASTTAQQVFGYERCLAEGNWFVSEGLGESYGRVFELLKEGCERAGATAAQERAVFAGNARRVYKLDAPAPGAPL